MGRRTRTSAHHFTLLALAVIGFAAIVSARGYNETTEYLGVENYGSFTTVQVINSANTLQIRGGLFGSSGGATLSQWASRLSCTYGGVSYAGMICLQYAFQDIGYAVVEGVRAYSDDFYNTAILFGQGQKDSAYLSGGPPGGRGIDDGQGPSCNKSDTIVPLRSPCTAKSGPVDRVELSPNVFNFPTRGLKFTCKAACANPGGPTNKTNFDSLMTELTNAMFAANSFSARFAIQRLNTGKVLARCRFTSANIGQFGLDTCPDVVSRWGDGFNNDLQPYNPNSPV